MALNLQAKQPKEDEPQAGTKNQKDTENRENKIRKTDDSTTKPAQSIVQMLKDEKSKGESTNKKDSNESESSHSADVLAESSESGQPKPSTSKDEKMVIGSPEPTNDESLAMQQEEEEEEDIGEIHIVSIDREFHKKC